MDGTVAETPPRKRTRCFTPSSSSHNVNKRFRLNTPISPSPRTVRFDSANVAQEDAILESDVPESPIGTRKGSNRGLSVSCEPHTPPAQIKNPFAKLKVSSADKKSLATPVAVKANAEGSKSVKKSARKTPGSAKSTKAFRIKVQFICCDRC